MTLRAVGFALLLVGALLLQTVVAPAMELFGVTPNLLALSTVCVGMAAGPGAGLRYGFSAGLAAGLLAGSEAVLGVAALLLLLGGYAAGLTRPFIAASEIVGQIVVGGVAVAMLSLADQMFGWLLGRAVSPVDVVLLQALVGGLYAAVLAPLVCLLVERLDRVGATSR